MNPDLSRKLVGYVQDTSLYLILVSLLNMIYMIAGSKRSQIVFKNLKQNGLDLFVFSKTAN